MRLKKLRVVWSFERLFTVDSLEVPGDDVMIALLLNYCFTPLCRVLLCIVGVVPARISESMIKFD